MSETLDSVCSGIKISLPHLHLFKCHMHTCRVPVQANTLEHILTHTSVFCHYIHTIFLSLWLYSMLLSHYVTLPSSDL